MNSINYQRIKHLPQIGFAVLLILSTSLPALEYEFSDDGLDVVEWGDGGRSEFEFADLNKDGHVDILSVGDHGAGLHDNQHGILVFFGDGTGRWDVVMEGDFGYGGIAVGDVNNDGEWDVGYGMHHNYAENDFGDQQIEVVLGDGSGENWEPWDDGLAVPRGDDDWYGMFGTDFGDINNDGLLDIGSNSFGSGTGLHIYNNLGNGEWEDAFYYFGRMNSATDFVFGDINNDGNLDFACTLEDMEVYLSDGEGEFEFAQYNLPNPPEFEVYLGVDLGDVDNDGADDLAFIFVNGGYQVSVFTFDPERERWNDISDGLPGDRGAWRIDLYDMDVDGDQDIIFSGSEGIEVWLQDPDGDPRWSQEWSMGFEDFSGIQAIRAGGDVDHNGFPDIVLLVRIRTGFMQTQNFIHVLRETSEAEELWIRPVEPGGGEVFVAGSVRFIDWAAAIPPDINADNAVVDLFFSPRGPDDEWIQIAEGIPNGGRFQWTVPGVESRNCYIMYVLDTEEGVVEAVSPAPFTIIGGEPVPNLAVDPRRINFMNVEPEEQAEETVTLMNIGVIELVVDPPELAIGEVFSVEGGEEELHIDPGEEVELRVVFEPPEEGLWNDTLYITSDGGNAAVIIFGRTAGIRLPMLNVSPERIDFGRILAGDAARENLLIINQGDSTAVIDIPQAGAGPFFWDEVDDELLAPLDTMTVEVEFAPQDNGNFSAELTISYQLGNLVVPVTGSGYSAPLVYADRDTIDFGDVEVNTEIAMNFTLLNAGNALATVDIARPSIGAFRWDYFGEFDLEAGDSLVVAVTFAPWFEMEYTREIPIAYQEGDFSIFLTGRGVNDVSAQEDVPPPGDFGITSISPNPFNSSVRIGFDLPAAELVSLKIYDTSGSIVAEPLNRNLPQGSQIDVKKLVCIK